MQDGLSFPPPGISKSPISPVLAELGVGAPPGYGLTNPSALEARGPILIKDNAGFTAANGVRRGSGTAIDPYVISDWSIDGSPYLSTVAMIWIEGTSKYAVIQNVQITGLSGSNQWYGVLLGTNAYPVITPIRTENVTVRHILVSSQHAYGIQASEGAKNVNISSNWVILSANRNWVYSAVAQRGSHNVTFYGNRFDATAKMLGTGKLALTVGLHLGDYYISDSRKATRLAAYYNTITNATTSAIQSEGDNGTIIAWNLIFHNYPGLKTVDSATPVRGIATTENSDATQIFGNEIRTVEHGIETWMSLNDRAYSNNIHDVTDAILMAGSRPVVFDTAYRNVTHQVFTIVATSYTLLDVGPGVTPSDFSMVRFVGNQTPTRITYAWAGTRFNLSLILGSTFIYDHQESATSQDLEVEWSGASLILSAKQFVPENVTFTLESTTGVGLRGSGFRPLAYYEISKGSTRLANTTTTPAGGLTASLPSPVSATYSIRFTGFVTPPASDRTPPVVSILSPANQSYQASSSVQVTWSASDVGSGLARAELTLDAEAPINVTGKTSYALTGLADGTRQVLVTATDKAGLATTKRVTFTVDTQPPVVSITSPTANEVTNSSTLLIAWAASDAGSGLHHVEVRLDGGPSLVPTGSTYAIGGLVNGSHQISVTAVDNVGHSSTVSVSFTVDTGSGGASNTPPSLAPAVAAISYAPDASAVDILFTQSMNQTSVVESLALSPSVDYGLQWVNESHLRVVIQGSLVRGAVYQVTLKDTAKGSAGESLEHPFLFQFYAHALDGADAILSTNWTPILFLVIVGLMGANGVTAGFLMFHYRKDADRVRSAFEQVAERYERQIGSLYERLSRSTTYEKKTRVRFPANSTKFDEQPIVVRRSR